MAQSRLLLPILALTLGSQALPARALELPFGIGGGDRAAARPAERAPEVRMAQAGDGGVRVAQMEEEMRRLTGKVEELSFLVLQLQEQLRKTQEDNEFRFQDLEKGAGTSKASAPQRKTEVTPPVAPAAVATPPAATPPSTSSRVASVTPPSANDATAPRAAAPAPAPQTDEIGALLNGSAVSQPLPTTEPSVPPSDKVASIRAEGPVELYSLGYNYMLAGDYHLAETTFRQYTQAYPTSSDAPDAQYWLGEALYAQAKYRDAAEVFLNAQKANPQAPKAPEMMLKLGMSLARLDNRETACVTYGEVSRRYPAMSANVKRKLQAEEKSASCS
ncbi:tol-pal system protein YbgF [Aureimonas sp. AU4]|uniref:tol-pal system protein YbgF n=1 Tax=Aureimonas sp. AU4 TaxID=1638163 RepID=UPI0007829FBD|nr:tol-pal system protein YbgF [Aureimonas sp. AU4]